MVEIIYEIGLNHNGDMATAKKLIDVAHTAGCNYVKFQKRNNSLVYTKEQLDAPRESPWGKTYGEYREHVEFDMLDYREISEHCYGKVPWFATPFDIDSLRFLKFYPVPFIKVASIHLRNYELLEAIGQAGKPVIMSTGMSDWEMIDKAIDIVGKDTIYCIMQCNSCYPAHESELNLHVIPEMKKRYPFAKVGFSNHHPGIIYMLMAATLGVEMIEFHGTLDRAMYGSDHAASIEPEGVHKLVKYIRGVEKALGSSEKFITESEVPHIARLGGEI